MIRRLVFTFSVCFSLAIFAISPVQAQTPAPTLYPGCSPELMEVMKRRSESNVVKEGAMRKELIRRPMSAHQMTCYYDAAEKTTQTLADKFTFLLSVAVEAITGDTLNELLQETLVSLGDNFAGDIGSTLGIAVGTLLPINDCSHAFDLYQRSGSVDNGVPSFTTLDLLEAVGISGGDLLEGALNSLGGALLEDYQDALGFWESTSPKPDVLPISQIADADGDGDEDLTDVLIQGGVL